MWPGPSGFGSGKGNRSGSGSGSLYSHSYWLTIFVQPIGAQCCRRRGRKIQIILGGKTQCLMNLLQMGQQLLRTITKTLTRIELIKTTLILGTHLNKYIYVHIYSNENDIIPYFFHLVCGKLRFFQLDLNNNSKCSFSLAYTMHSNCQFVSHNKVGKNKPKYKG